MKTEPLKDKFKVVRNIRACSWNGDYPKVLFPSDVKSACEYLKDRIDKDFPVVLSSLTKQRLFHKIEKAFEDVYK